MAKVRKYKLSWEPSDSKNITGYKVYWSYGDSVNYESKSLEAGNATEVTLSGDMTSSGSTVMFGVAAIDKDGNESDITTMAKPYYFHVPKAPEGLSIRPLDDFRVVDKKQPQSQIPKKVAETGLSKQDDDNSLAEAIESHGEIQRPRRKYYDDVGYRNMQ